MLIMLLVMRNLVGRRLLTRTLLVLLCAYEFMFAMTTFFCNSLDTVAARGVHLGCTRARCAFLAARARVCSSLRRNHWIPCGCDDDWHPSVLSRVSVRRGGGAGEGSGDSLSTFHRRSYKHALRVQPMLIAISIGVPAVATVLVIVSSDDWKVCVVSAVVRGDM